MDLPLPDTTEGVCPGTAVAPDPAPNLSTSTKVETSTGPYASGDSITWDITITNSGDADATGVTVDDPTADDVTPPGPFVIAAGGQQVVTVTKFVDESAPPGLFTNTATITSVEGPPVTVTTTTATPIDIAGPVLTCPDPLVTLRLGDPAMITFTADEPVTWTVDTLPAGLTIDAATGTISGTPTAIAGPLTVTVQATDPAGNAAFCTFDIEVLPLLTLVKTFERAAMGGLIVGETVTFNMALTNHGTEDLAISSLVDSLPVTPFGPTPEPTTVAAGQTASWAVQYQVQPGDAGADLVNTMTVNGDTPSGGAVTVSASADPIAIAPIPTITNCPATQQNLATGGVYSFVPLTQGATSPVTWSVDALPPGVNLNTATGEVSGSPTTAGQTVSTLTGTDDTGQTMTCVVTYDVIAAPQLTFTKVGVNTDGPENGDVTTYTFSVTNDDPVNASPPATITDPAAGIGSTRTVLYDNLAETHSPDEANLVWANQQSAPGYRPSVDMEISEWAGSVETVALAVDTPIRIVDPAGNVLGTSDAPLSIGMAGPTTDAVTFTPPVAVTAGTWYRFVPDDALNGQLSFDMNHGIGNSSTKVVDQNGNPQVYQTSRIRVGGEITAPAIAVPALAPGETQTFTFDYMISNDSVIARNDDEFGAPIGDATQANEATLDANGFTFTDSTTTKLRTGLGTLGIGNAGARNLGFAGFQITPTVDTKPEEVIWFIRTLTGYNNNSPGWRVLVIEGGFVAGATRDSATARYISSASRRPSGGITGFANERFDGFEPLNGTTTLNAGTRYTFKLTSNGFALPTNAVIGQENITTIHGIASTAQTNEGMDVLLRVTGDYPR